MVKNKIRAKAEENESYILPSENDGMVKFVNNFKIDMMEHIVSSIEFALKNKLPIIEVFQFKNSPFVITINEEEFDSNLTHIEKFYTENKIDELCPRIKNLKEILNKKINEKRPKDINGSNIK